VYTNKDNRPYTVNAQIEEHLEFIYQADPQLDVQEAIKGKDFRFVGFISGDRAPWVSTCLVDEFGFRELRGTGDAVENYAHAKLQALTRVYAENYNLLMFGYIIENNLSECE
jgi:hypothetical protein